MAEDFRDSRFVKDLPVLLGWEEARDERIHANITVGPLARDVAREIVNGSLGG